MASRSTGTKADSQDLLSYRRDLPKGPEEVLSEARKNHSIFKSNVVSGGLRPSARHVGLSRFQFGDGEYSASVESMQRYIAEKTAKPEPLPELLEPVPLTCTLSRSTSSRGNPFRAGVRVKPPPILDFPPHLAASKIERSSDMDDTAVSASAAQDRIVEMQEGASAATAATTAVTGNDITNTHTATELESDGAGDEPGGTQGIEAVAAAATTAPVFPRREAFTIAASNGFSTGSVVSAAQTSRRSTSQSFRSLPNGPTLSAGQTLDGQAYGISGTSGEDVADMSGGDGHDDLDDISDGEASSCHGFQRSVTVLNASFGSPQYPHQNHNHYYNHHSATDSNLDMIIGNSDVLGGFALAPAARPSAFGAFARRSSIQSTFWQGGGGSDSSGIGPSDSSTVRVDQMLRDLRRLKGVSFGNGVGSVSSSAVVSPRGVSSTVGGSGGATALFVSRANRTTVDSGSARASSSGSGRFESAREMFAARGRSATSMNSIVMDDDRPMGQSAANAATTAAASSAGTSAGGEAADSLRQLSHQKLGQRFHRNAMSYSQLNLPMTFPPAPPPGPVPTQSPSSRHSVHSAAAAATQQQQQQASGNLPQGMATAPQGARGSIGSTTSISSISFSGSLQGRASRAPLTVEDDSCRAASSSSFSHSTQQSPFLSGAMLGAGACTTISQHPPSGAPQLEAASTPTTAAAALSPLDRGRASSRKNLMEAPMAAAAAAAAAALSLPPPRVTAAGAPLSSWSSRKGGSRSSGVGGFFANLLSVATGPIRPTDP